MKTKILLLFLLTFSTFFLKLNAQNPFIEWEQSFGGSNVEQCTAMRETGDGGFIATGNAGSQDGDVTGNHGGFDYWLVKTGADGTLQWQRTYGGCRNVSAICSGSLLKIIHLMN